MQRTTRFRLLLFTQSIMIAAFAFGGCSRSTPPKSEPTQPPAQPKSHSAAVVSTPMEAALDALRRRYPDSVVVGFEELWDARPDTEPKVDLGPPDATFNSVVERIGNLNPTYKLDLVEHLLVHVHPAHGSADPAHLLDIRLKRFVMPADHCLEEAMRDIASHNPLVVGGYAPELSQFLNRKQLDWDHQRGKGLPHGVIGGGLGGCAPVPSLDHQGVSAVTVYRDITVREAMNRMALRSLLLSRREVRPNDGWEMTWKPISWRFRFRPEPDADTGLGGVPVFQTF